MRNFQRDGVRRMDVNVGQVAYEPNSLALDGPRESPGAGFVSFAEDNTGGKVRERSETFADHYSQARLFWRSMTEPEQRHIVSAFVFELSKVSTLAVRRRMLGHLMNIHPDLSTRVAAGMGMEGQADTIKPARPLVDMKPSPALSLIAKAPKTLDGRKVGVLVTDGSDGALVQALKAAVEKAGAQLQVVAPKVGGAKVTGGAKLAADHQLAGGPSIFFDAVVVAPSAEGTAALLSDAAAIDWVRDAFGHLKVIGVVDAAKPLLDRAGVKADGGVVAIQGPKDVAAFITAAKNGRVWDREPQVRPAL
jgi:catalase